MAARITANKIVVPEFLSGGGEMGKLIRSKDWSKTPLGSPDTWPQSLRTAVSICIASNFPIAIAWSPHRVQIYNDGYWPITGNMHPRSMGQDFKECWISAWPVIGQAFEEASLGQTRFLENQRIFLDRYGYKEETFFTFSFSPILDESGGVGGLFHPVIELTQQTIAERRLNVLRVVADNTVNARTLEEASALILECLKDFDLDLPFVLLYAIDADGKEANLQGNVGVERHSPLAPANINLEEHALKTWPFTEAIQKEKAVQVEELGKIFGTFECGPYAEPPEQALVFPVTLHGTEHNNYVLVAGVSSRRNLDEKYRLFYELLSASVTNALTKARAYDEERKKAEALAEIDKAKTVFFSNISHEFRTPLTLMLGSLEGLLNKSNGDIGASEKEAIETSHRNAMRLLRLVNNLLDFSRIEAGRVQARYQLTDLTKYTNELASSFRSVVENAGLTFQVKTDAVIQPVYIDKEMWEKIVLNLLSNAFKYTLNGSITLSLTTENNHVLLKLKDTGVGIPEKELPKMFQRFHRVQNVVGRTYEGTGIGLSLVSELVKLHGGEISVQSKEAEGSVFTVSIPTGKLHLPTEHVFEKETDFTASFSDAFIDEATTLLDHSLLPGNGTDSLEGRADAATVLVVDDNADMRAYIKNLLRKQYHVVTANNGMEALQRIKEHSPQLIVSDIMMPVMDGIGLLKAVKENVQTRNIPVILLSARAGEESKIEGYEIGADDYLVKPFSAKELIARVSSNIKTAAIRNSAERHLYSLLMQTPVAIAIYRGPNFVVELVNDRMLEFYGKPREEIINRPIFEVFPEVAAHGVEALHRKVYETGERVIANEQKHEYYKNGKLYNGYFNTVFEPLRDLDANIIGIIVTGHEVTEGVTARKKIEDGEKQQAFLLKLSDALRPLGNSLAIEEAVTKIAMDFMDADRCLYATIEEDNLIVQRDAVRENLPSVAGEYHISNFALIKAILDAGRPFIVDDVQTTDKLDEELKQLCLQWQNISFINVPVIRNGKAVGLLSIVQSRPRKWTDTEVLITIETAERTWAAVERAKAEEALRKSEEKYRTLFDSMDEGFSIVEVLFDDKGKAVDYIFLEMNPAHEAMSGLPRTVVGKRIREFMPDIEENLLERVGKIALTGESVRYEQYVSELNRWFEVHSSRVGGKGSHKVAFVLNNITERKQAEEKIKESESRFRTMADASPLLIWTIDANGLSSYYNKTFLDFIGVSKEEDISDWGKIVHPDDAQPTFDTIKKSIAERCSYSLECRLLRADGDWRWMLAQGNPNIGAHNEFLGFVGSSVDITERKRAEAKISESEERFRSLAQTLPQLVWGTDAQGNAEFASVRWKEYSGIEPGGEEEWKAIVHPDDYDNINATWVHSLTTGEVYTAEVRLKNKDGQYKWHAVIGEPVVDKENKITKWVGAFTDIHEQKTFSVQLEEKVNERTIQLNEVNKNLEEKNNELQKMNKELEAFTYVSSHDLQEPLRKIQTFAGRIIATEKEHLSDTAKDYFSRMQYSALRMQTLIHDLLTFSRVSTSERKFEKIHLAKIIDEVKEDFNETIEDKNAIITAGEMCEVNIISFQFRQLMHNLISNALKFSKPDVAPRIIIKSELIAGSNSPFESQDACHITVIDNGIGFEQHYSEKIFGVFQKLHGKDEYAGTGIGLAIVKKIVDNHNGIITAESEIGKGATFNIYLPH